MPENAKSMRRAPTQKRSRERVENILNAACELISVQGSDLMKMGELAERAGVSIGSLYQYFPDKAAIIHALADRYNAESRHCIEDGLGVVTSADALVPAFERLVDIYYELFLAEPVICDIWSGTQADKTLRDMELEVSRSHADFLCQTIFRLAPAARAHKEDIAARCLLIMYMCESTMRLAISVSRDEGKRVVAGYKAMTQRELEAMLNL